MADRHPAAQTGGAGSDASALDVLLVDDDEALNSSLAAFFRERGCRVRTAASVPEARRCIEAAEHLDVVVTDIYLGETDGEAGGHALARWCAEHRPWMPVLLLTGRPSIDAAVAGLRDQACDFLTKPIDPPLLLARCRRAVEEQRIRRRLARLERDNRILSAILPNAIEAKDPTTRGHSDRVVAYADGLARRMGVGERERRELRLAARLHDVGKIGIPEAILTKPGPLTPDEREVIKEHPAIGYRILEPLDELPRVRDWVFQHHERWDGKGYPQGLEGEDVALPGRILILAEVYDALATARSYKQPWSRDRIADFFEQEAGRHFDPDLARIVAAGVRAQGAAFFTANGDEGGQQALF